MASTEVDLEPQLKDVGKQLSHPLDSNDELLLVLDRLEKLLLKVDQSPKKSMLEALRPSINALIRDSLLKHSDMDVKVSVASCISEITRITAPNAPYTDDQMSGVFQLIVSSFEDLADWSSRSYHKRASILGTVSKFRSCVIMLDLECDELIVKMFEHFLKSVRDYHLDAIYSSMENIMVLVIEESEEILVELLKPLLASVKKDRVGVLPIAHKLGKEVLLKSADKLKPYMKPALISLNESLDKYHKVVAAVCEGTTANFDDNDAEDNDADQAATMPLACKSEKDSVVEAQQADESKVTTAASDHVDQVVIAEMSPKEKEKDDDVRQEDRNEKDDVKDSEDINEKDDVKESVNQNEEDKDVKVSENQNEEEKDVKEVENEAVESKSAATAQTNNVPDESSAQSKKEPAPEKVKTASPSKIGPTDKSLTQEDTPEAQKQEGKEIVTEKEVELVDTVNMSGDDEASDSDAKPLKRSKSKPGKQSGKKSKQSGKKVETPIKKGEKSKIEDDEDDSDDKPLKKSAKRSTSRKKNGGKQRKVQVKSLSGDDEMDICAVVACRYYEGVVSEFYPAKRKHKEMDLSPMIAVEEDDSDDKPLKQSGKKSKQSGKKLETPVNKGEKSKIEDYEDGSDYKPLKKSAKRSTSRNKNIGKQRKDQAKSLSGDDEMDISPKSDKGEGNSTETPVTGAKRKRSTGKDEISVTIKYDQSLIGEKVKVWWPEDKMYYEGVVSEFYPAKRKHKVSYVDGNEVKLNLRTQKWKIWKAFSVRDDEEQNTKKTAKDNIVKAATNNEKTEYDKEKLRLEDKRLRLEAEKLRIKAEKEQSKIRQEDERLRLEAEKMKLLKRESDDRIMMMDVSLMPEMQRLYFVKLQREIVMRCNHA